MSQESGTVATEEQKPERPTDAHVTTDDSINPQAATSEDPVDKTGKSAATTDQDGANKDDSAASTQNSEKSKTRDRASERKFAKMRRQLTAAQRTMGSNAAEIAELKAQIDAHKSADTKAKPKPVITDFDDPEVYAEKLTAWKAEQEQAAKPAAKPAAKETPDQSAAAASANDDELLEFQEFATEKLGDAFLAIKDDKDDPHPVNEIMGDFILGSEHGPEVYVYLANHHDEAREIHDNSKAVATRKLKALETKAKAGKLELGKPADGDEGKKTDKTGDESKGKLDTKAPKPPGDQDQPGDATPGKRLDEISNMDEYAARRRKDEAAGKGSDFT